MADYGTGGASPATIVAEHRLMRRQLDAVISILGALTVELEVPAELQTAMVNLEGQDAAMGRFMATLKEKSGV